MGERKRLDDRFSGFVFNCGGCVKSNGGNKVHAGCCILM